MQLALQVSHLLGLGLNDIVDQLQQSLESFSTFLSTRQYPATARHNTTVIRNPEFFASTRQWKVNSHPMIYVATALSDAANMHISHLSLSSSDSADLLAPFPASSKSWMAFLDMLAQADTSAGLRDLPAATAFAEASVIDWTNINKKQ